MLKVGNLYYHNTPGDILIFLGTNRHKTSSSPMLELRFFNISHGTCIVYGPSYMNYLVENQLIVPLQ